MLTLRTMLRSCGELSRLTNSITIYSQENHKLRFIVRASQDSSFYWPEYCLYYGSEEFCVFRRIPEKGLPDELKDDSGLRAAFKRNVDLESTNWSISEFDKNHIKERFEAIQKDFNIIMEN